MSNQPEHLPHNLSTLIGESTNRDQFEQIVEQLLPSRAKDILGADAKDKVRDALLNLSIFGTAGPEAFFDEEALHAVWDSKDDAEFSVLLETMKELGVIEVKDQYVGPTPQEDKKDKELLEGMGLNLPPRPRHTAKNRLRVVDINLAQNLYRIFGEYEE